MKNIRIIIFILSIFLISCTTSIPVEVTVPPKLNYNGAKRIGVLPFRTAQEDASQRFNETGLSNWLYYFEKEDLNKEMKLASYLTSRMENLLAGSNYFYVISSEQLKKELKTNNFPVEALVTGNISNIIEDSDKDSRKYTDENGNVSYRYSYEKSTKVTIDFKILSAKDFLIIDSYSSTFKASDKRNDLGPLKTHSELAIDAINTILKDVKYLFIPETYTEYRRMAKLENKEDPRLEKINQYIRGKFYSEAYVLYENIYKETGDPAARYNTILLTEISGNLDKAITDMTEFAKQTGYSKAIKQITRMKKAKANLEALK